MKASSSSSPDASTQGLSDLTTTTTLSSPNPPSLTPWHETISTSISRSQKIRGGNYAQLATVDPISNEPRCRTVVFRGFLDLSSSSLHIDEKQPCDNTHVLKMMTDLRTCKVAETTGDGQTNNNTAEMVLWFSKSSEQYRLRGSLYFVGDGTFPWDADEELQQARRQQWADLSDPAREQLYWRDPGATFETQTTVPVGGRDEEGKVIQPPPDNFLLMLLYPRRVDYLRLGDNYRQIDEYEKEGGWGLTRVNP